MRIRQAYTQIFKETNKFTEFRFISSYLINLSNKNIEKLVNT